MRALIHVLLPALVCTRVLAAGPDLSTLQATFDRIIASTSPGGRAPRGELGLG